ncbi:hypothetical protein Hte_002342 [Hypoxylon texense]
MFAEVQEKEGVPNDLMAYFSGSLLQAGSETTMATLLGFVQAMVIFPDVARAGQAEIDRVAIHNDPNRYPNPRKFDPTRWANDNQSSYESARNPDVTQRDHYSFGVGRRMCLAMNLVDQSLFLAISRLLWAFDFNRAIDQKTKEEIIPDMEDLASGLFTMPNPFRARIVPRDQSRIDRIRQDWLQASEELLDQDMQWREVP